MEVAFSLGSNIGDRMKHLVAGREGLRQALRAGLLEQSSVYETEPLGVAPEHKDLAFLNAVVIVQTSCGALDCLEACRDIEACAGRERDGGRNVPRPLDIDIIYAGDIRMQDMKLTIPHPRWASRGFVLRPLAELRPGLVLQDAEYSVSKLLDDLGENGKVDLFVNKW